MSKVSIVLAPIAVTREDAAAALGMSLASFERYVQPDLALIREGKLRLVPVAELQRWAQGNARPVLGNAA